MYKTKTYLHEFNTQTKRNYDTLGKYKSVFWLIICVIALAIQYIPTIGFVFLLVGTGVFQKLQSLQLLSNITITTWLNLVIGTSLVIGSYYIFIKLFEKRPFYTIGLRQDNKLLKYCKGASVAIVMQLSYFFIVLTFGWAEILSEPIYATTRLGPSAIGYVILFLIGFMIQGASEEIVVRGWMLPILSRQYKISTAIIISSLFFGFLHIFNPNINLLSIINLVLYGIFAALYAINDGGLWGIFAQHSIWNWFMGNVLGLPVSGMIIGNVSIIETKLIGPTYITGGSFGPEGGIIVTVIELIGIVIVMKLLIKKHSKA